MSKCGECQKDLGIECAICNCDLHRSCAKLTTVYKDSTKKETVVFFWLCSICIENELKKDTVWNGWNIKLNG